ncbi:MAG TPA: hypothetical protein VD816_15450, partial [Ohtaekwangia sp.]|nr:hypothetical protein [Ohtaekwangia sp.]
MNGEQPFFLTSEDEREAFKAYRPPFFLFNAHLETIYPSLFRKVALRPYTRERIITTDNDFLDLDWLKQGSS